MVNWSHIEEYGKKFHLSTEQINSLKNCFENINIDFLEQFIKLPLNQLPSENELKKNFRDEQEMQRFLLLGILISYPEFEKFYHDSGYPDKMFEDISYDLSIWQEKMLAVHIPLCKIALFVHVRGRIYWQHGVQ